ncbi:MAG: copper homeostasis protein CutC [Rubellimicrobium sp.]|nr:copper homeostasis protein CutC [Rubellimicrobium sp.]
MILEICVDGPEGLLAAHEGGADRVELCSALALGGLTPSPALLTMASRLDMPAVAMIRPRAGDFVWTGAETAFMEHEIETMQSLGALGVVLGASLPDGRLDESTLRRLLAGVDEGREAVLHRAFDLTPDKFAALELAIDMGFDRILTSGGEPGAPDGLDLLAQLVERARGRIAIMPGAGITADNAGRVLAALPVDTLHAGCSRAVPQPEQAVALGFTGPERPETDAAQVRALRAAMAAG